MLGLPGLILVVAGFAVAVPAPTAAPIQIAVARPYPAPTPVNPAANPVERRDILSDVKSLASQATADINSVLSSLGSAVPSYVASGVPNFFEGFPTGNDVQKSLGVSDEQASALPLQVLNIPPYANWTNGGWNLRLHGNVYKQPNISQSKLDDLANIFLIDTDIKDLPPDQQAQARNLTSEIFILQQDNVHLKFNFVAITDPIVSNNTNSPNATVQDVVFPDGTSTLGDFEEFIPLTSFGLAPGNATSFVQTMNVFTNTSNLGNATAYFVPDEGISIISDIDDVLRVTKIYQPKEGLLNSFARPYTPWDDMPVVYKNISTLTNVHFHYLTTTPEQGTRNYMAYIFANYPPGSFDTRPLRFSDPSATIQTRKYLLDKFRETFPKRKMYLVGDTSNSDLMRDYPQALKDNPDQIACIWMRNTSATDSGDKFPYDTSGFEGIDQSKFMFFRTPADLMHLDVSTGGCYNTSVKQNLTFSYQGLPFGLGKKSAGVRLVTMDLKWPVIGAWGIVFTLSYCGIM